MLFIKNGVWSKQTARGSATSAKIFQNGRATQAQIGFVQELEFATRRDIDKLLVRLLSDIVLRFSAQTVTADVTYFLGNTVTNETTPFLV